MSGRHYSGDAYLLIEFDARPYVRAHGKRPRGTGVWAFDVNGATWFTPFPMTLTLAKQWVHRQLRDKGEFGLWIVEVLS